MGVSCKLAFNYLKNNKKRTIIMISSLLITTMLITLILLISNSYKALLVSNDRKNENWEIRFSDITFEEAKIIEKHSNIKEISIIQAVNYGYVRVNNKKVFIGTVFLLDTNALNNLLSSKLTEGRFPTNSNEILVRENNLEDYKIGDKLNIKHNGITKEYNIVGMIDDTANFKYDTQNQIICYLNRNDLEDSNTVDITVLTQNIHTIYDDFYDIYYALDSYRNDTDNSLINKTEYNTILLEHEGVLEYNSFFKNTFYSTEGILVIVIIVISVIFIYSITNIGIVERKRYFGILNSVGATTKQMRNSLKVELLIILGIAIPFGIIIGILITCLFIAILNSQIPNLINYSGVISSLFTVNDHLRVAIPFSTLFIFIIILILITYIATALPIRKVGRIKAIRLIKDNKEKVKIKKKVSRQIPIERKLAFKNIERYKIRYAAIIISLTVSIVLIIVSSYYIFTHLKTDNQFNYNYEIDINYLESENPNLVENIITDLKEENITNDAIAMARMSAQIIVDEENISDEEKEYSPLLYEGDYSKYVHYSIARNKNSEIYHLPTSLLVLNNELYDTYLNSLGIKKLENNECILVDYINEKTKYYDGIRLTNYKEGDKIKVKNVISNTNIEENFSIIKVANTLPVNLSSTYTYNTYLIVNPNGINYMLNSLYIIDDYDEKYYGIMFNTNNIDEMDNFIKKMTDKYNLDDNNINSYSTASRNEENELNIMIKVFIYTFIGIITLIGILNIYNAINSSLEVRKKEIISLITLGMEEKQINKMILLENMLCGLISLVLGILFGIFISYLIYFLTVNYRWYAFEMPWNSLVISLILIVLIIIFFTFYLKKRLFSGNLIEILKREN